MSHKCSCASAVQIWIFAKARKLGMTKMTAVLLLGLLRRERKGPANIGFESAIILSLYVGAVIVQANLG